MKEKLERLREILKGFGGVAVAFSSGVDSTFLLAFAKEVLGENVLAVCAEAPFVPARETAEGISFCAERSIRRVSVRPDLLSSRAFTENPPDRCYHCKRQLMSELSRAARAEGFPILAEGSNADDAGAYRPGMRALTELGIRSPLLDAGLTKKEIRALSKDMGLPTWDKPSYACLATRFPYGESVTEAGLIAVDGAEELLYSLGIRQFRVRAHGRLARIEVEKGDMPTVLSNSGHIAEGFRELGFNWISLDLEGFRSGSMDV